MKTSMAWCGSTFQKEPNFDEVTVEFLGRVEEALNNRPRRRYGFLTPLERFSELTGLPAVKFFYGGFAANERGYF